MAEALLLVPELRKTGLAAVLAEKEEDGHAANAEEKEDEML